MIKVQNKTHAVQRLRSAGLATLLVAATVQPYFASAAALHRVATTPQTYKETKIRPVVIAVRVDPTADISIDEINATHSTITLRKFQALPETYLLRVRDDGDANKVLKALNGDKRLLYAELEMLSTPPEADPINIKAWGMDPTPYHSQDALQRLNLERAHALSQGKGMVVAVIDTGVQLNHPALSPFYVAGYDFVDGDAIAEDIGNTIDDDGDGSVDEATGHGTHIAGIVHLVAPEARIMPIRVLDADGVGSLFDVIDGIAFAVQNGARVINLSLSVTDKSRLLSDTVRYATERGVVVVASAGNLNDNLMQYPAADPCAIAVTSVNAMDIRSYFSSYGGWIDFAAPGEGIYSTFVGGGYSWWSGTSMAAPFVAGQAAVLLAIDPGLNAREVAGVIEKSSHKIDQLKLNKDYHKSLGIGRIDIGASTELLASGTFKNSGPKTIKGGCVH